MRRFTVIIVALIDVLGQMYMTKAAKTMRRAQQVNGSVRSWTRRSFSVVVFFAVGLAAGPASATVLFTEDFSGHALDPGPGFMHRGGINGTNGWFLGHGTDNVRVSDTPVLGMVGNYGDMSPGQGSSDGNRHSNDAGIGGGMDPNAEYRLTWTQTVLAATSVEVGLRKGTRQHARLGLSDRFNNYAGLILLRGPEGDDTVSWENHIGDGGTADFEMIITQDRVSFEIDGVGGGGRQMDAATMAQIDGIHIWSDYSNNRNGGYIDNIMLTLVPEPGTFSLLALGSLIALRRRRAATG